MLMQCVYRAACCFCNTATNGVVIATEKKLPTVLIDETEVAKTSLITPSTGFVYSGLGPDYRVLVRKARKKAQA
jgi:20S proteasome subunit alpha 2